MTPFSAVFHFCCFFASPESGGFGEGSSVFVATRDLKSCTWSDICSNMLHHTCGILLLTTNCTLSTVLDKVSHSKEFRTRVALNKHFANVWSYVLSKTTQVVQSKIQSNLPFEAYLTSLAWSTFVYNNRERWKLGSVSSLSQSAQFVCNLAECGNYETQYQTQNCVCGYSVWL